MLGRLFSSFCGKESHTKHIPYWAMLLPDDKLWPLVESMFNGDGTIDFAAGTLRYSTVSEELARQLQFVLLQLGVVSSLRSAKYRVEYTVTVHRPEIFKVPFVYGVQEVKKTQSQFVRVKDGYLFPIRNVTKKLYSGTVYNLEVDEDHSYLMGGGAVHNCLPILEALSTGVPVVATDTGAITELLEDGRGFLVFPEYTFMDVWGNSKRDMIDREKAAQTLIDIYRGVLDAGAAKNAAKEYVLKRTWDIPVAQLESKIDEVCHAED